MASATKINDDSGAPDLVSECRLMLRYARRNAFDLSPEVVNGIAQLDSILKQLGFDPISDIDKGLVSGGSPRANGPPPDIQSYEIANTAAIPQAPPPASAPVSSGAEEMLLNLHGELSKVIAPTTALTLQASEPPPGKHRFLGGMPLIVKAASLVAVLSAILFAVSAGDIARKAAAAKEKAQPAVKLKAGESKNPTAEYPQNSQNPPSSSESAGNEGIVKP